MGELKKLAEAVANRLTKKGVIAKITPNGDIVIRDQLVKLVPSFSFGVAVSGDPKDEIVVECILDDDFVVEKVTRLILMALP